MGKITETSKALAKWRGKLTQKEAAQKLGVSLRTLQNWEIGRNEPRGFAKAALLQRLTTRERK